MELYIESHSGGWHDLMSYGWLYHSAAICRKQNLLDLWLQYSIKKGTLEHDDLSPHAVLCVMTTKKTGRYCALREFRGPFVGKDIWRKCFQS